MSFFALAVYLSIAIIIFCSASSAKSDFGIRRRRLAGGSDAPDGAYSYVVSIQINSRHVCAGTIVSPIIILTAAHCILDGYKYTVRAGSTSISYEGSVHAVEKFIRHEQYQRIEIKNNTFALNDLALVKVTPPMTGVRVREVQFLEVNETVVEGSDATLVGWGATRMRQEGDFDYQSSWDIIKSILINYDKAHYFSEKLRTASLNILPRERCAEKSLSAVLANQICAGSIHASTCKGDSGGPLLVNGRQVGVASSCGKKCGSETSRSLFVNIVYYRDWIDQATKKLHLSLSFSHPYPIFR